jgi:hypothetical protein
MLHIEAVKALTSDCSGHIDPRVEQFGDNPTGAIKLIASKVRFSAMPAFSRLRLIWQYWRQVFQCRFSLRMNCLLCNAE